MEKMVRLDAGLIEADLTLNISPLALSVLEKVDKGDDIKLGVLKTLARFLPYVRKTIINKYMDANRQRKYTGENRIMQHTGKMAKSMQVRKNITTDENNYVVLYLNRNARTKKGYYYPAVLETGWRGRLGSRHKLKDSKEWNTNRFVPPFYYTYSAFRDNTERLSKMLLLDIKKTLKNITKEYLLEQLKNG